MRTITNAGLVIGACTGALLLASSQPLQAGHEEEAYRLLQLDGYKVKWGEHRLGAGARVSYAFADQAMHFEHARNCRDLAPIEKLAEKHLSLDVLEREAAAAFKAWEGAADLSFHKVEDAQEADIVIGAQGEPVGRAFANVAYGSEAKGNIRPIQEALVCLNPEKKWKIGFDGNTDVYDLRYTLIHEIGHAIGLDHPGPEGQIMAFRYTEAFAHLQAGDLRGIRELYGYPVDQTEMAGTDTEEERTLFEQSGGNVSPDSD